MKNYFRKIKDLYFHDISAIITVNPEILRYLENYKVTYANCERIILFFPLFLLTPVIGTILCYKNDFIFAIASVLTLLAWIFSIYTFLEIRAAKQEGEHEIYRRQVHFTKLYGSFFSIWFSLVLLISFCTFRLYTDGLYFFFIQLIIGFVPIYRQTKFKYFIWSEICGYTLILFVVYMIAGNHRFWSTFQVVGKGIIFGGLLILFTQLFAQKLLYRSYLLESMLMFVGYTDPLTNALNRRGCNYRLAELLSFYKKRAVPLGIIMFDIDYFKIFNDSLGHDAGDLVLKEIVHTIGEQLQGKHLLVRHGGEEFVILMLDVTAEETREQAWNIMQSIRDLHYPFPTELCNQLSISIGVDYKTICSKATNYEEYLLDADKALYQAKQKGRDQICYSQNMF